MPDNQLEKSKRLVLIRKTLGKSQQEMADILGLQRTSLSKIENGKERSVPHGTKYILQIELNVNPDWFETGEGEMFLGEKQDPGLVSEMFGLDRPQPPPDDLREKLIYSYEKNIKLLEEISALKDTLLEKEREIIGILRDEKKKRVST